MIIMSESSIGVTGFHHYDTKDFRLFNERIISDLERLIAALKKDQRFIKVEDFVTTFKNHLQEQPAHNLDITEFKQELLEQLHAVFLKYRSGSITDMMKIIDHTNIDVGTYRDLDIGWSDTKTVDAAGFRYLMHHHANDKSAHKKVFDRITPKSSFNYEPIFSFTADFRREYEVYAEHGYTLSAWNKEHGLLVLDVIWDFTGYITDGDVKLFTLKSVDDSLEFSMHYESTQSVLTFYLIRKNNDGELVETLYESVISIKEFAINGSDRFLFNYDSEKFTIRDQFSTKYLERRYYEPIALWVNGELNTSGIAIRELTGYAHSASIVEQLFFLD